MTNATSTHPARYITLFLAVITAGSIVAVSTPLLAQGDDTADENAQQGDEQTEQARRAFLDGREDYKNGEFSQAADHFLKAYRLSDRTELLYNIGQSYRKADRLVDAEHYFRKYLRRMPGAQNASEVGDYLVEINRTLADEMASLQINSDTSGRLVFFNNDDSPRCLTPCDLTLEPGDYEFELRADGFQPNATSVSLEQGKSHRVSLSLKPAENTGRLSVSTAVSGGILQIQSTASDDASDPGEHGLPLESPVKLAAGEYALTLKGPDGGSWSRTVDVRPDETATLFVPKSALSDDAPDSRSGGSAKQLAGIGLVGASAALIAGGALMGSQAQQTHDNLSTQQQTRGVVDPDLVSNGRAQMQAANILLGTGAAALLSGSGLITWDLLSR